MALMTFKPTSPGRRAAVRVVHKNLHKGAPHAALVEKQGKTGGRNNHGRITTRHIGGGHKQHYRVIDFKRNKEGIPARAAKMTKADWAQMQAESDANLKALVALMEAGKTPDSPEVQAEIARHHAGIGRFYDCAPAMYRNLGDMYLADQRFADTYRKWHPDLPEFLVKGIHAFCDRQEGKN